MSVSQQPAGQFEPRLGNQSQHAPYYPGSYYLVAFFGGIGALAVVALANLSRVSAVKNTTAKTVAIVAVGTVASLIFLLVAPATWWEPLRDIRLGLRVIAVVAGAGLYLVHRGPAFGAHVRFGEYHSMWKSNPLIPIIGAGIAQALLTALVGSIRGVL